jgi:hypothetical protein
LEKVFFSGVILRQMGDGKMVRAAHEFGPTSQKRDVGHPANDSMKGWSCYLHSEAVEAQLEILDTGRVAFTESVAHIVSYLRPEVGQFGSTMNVRPPKLV